MAYNNNNGGNNGYPQREKTVMDLPALSLFNKRDGAEKSNALSMHIAKGKLVMNVYPEDNRTKLTLRLDPLHTSQLLTLIEQAANASTSYRAEIAIGVFVRNGEPPKDATLVIGSSTEGLVYIGVKHPNWNEGLKFDFTPHYQFKIIDIKTGGEASRDQISRAIALGWANLVRQVYLNAFFNTFNLDDHIRTPGNKGRNNGQRQNNNQGGNQGYQQNNNYNNNGGNQSTPESFDDLDFL